MGQESPRVRRIAAWVRDRLPVLLRRQKVEAAYVFGSWAREEADDQSDLDLIVVADSSRPFVDRFRDFPELLRGPSPLDLIVYTPAEFARERRVNRFLRHVLREARRVV
jgi:predicted nucleotidyltransferase